MLSTILHDFPKDKFLREHLDRNTLYLPNPKAPKKSRLPIAGIPFGEVEMLKAARLIEQREGAPSVPAKLTMSRLRAHLRLIPGENTNVNITAQQIPEIVAQGNTALVAGLETVDPAWANFSGRLARELGNETSVVIGSFLSSRSSGAAMHFDHYGIFNVQIGGTKRWRIGKTPAVECPPISIGSRSEIPAFQSEYPELGLRDPKDEEFLEIEMKPGDVMYFPAGTWHEAAAGEYSLSLSMIMTAPRPHELLARSMAGALERSPLRVPPRFSSAGARRAWVRKAVAAAQGVLEASVDAIARDYEASAVPGTSQPAGSTGRGSRFPGQTSLRFPRPLWTEVRVHPTLLGAEVILSDGRQSMALGINSLGFVQWLTRAPTTFTFSEAARALADLYSPDEVQGALQVCLASGFLEASKVRASA